MFVSALLETRGSDQAGGAKTGGLHEVVNGNGQVGLNRDTGSEAW
jgi:hypothetical protein